MSAILILTILPQRPILRLSSCMVERLFVVTTDIPSGNNSSLRGRFAKKLKKEKKSRLKVALDTVWNLHTMIVPKPKPKPKPSL